jgi:thiol-disulfide isomerase/thioredoxin
MKSLFFFLLSIGLIISACKPEPDKEYVDYKTAYKQCPLDTHRMINLEGEIVESYSYTYKGLIGAQLPAFSATSMDGKQIDSMYFDNKVSVINFWFIGCIPCEHEMPVFNQLVEKYKGKDINFLSISRNSPADIQEFLASNPFDFDHIAYGEPIIVDTFGAAWGYPITFVADRDQTIQLIVRGLGDTTKVSDTQIEFIKAIDLALAEK